MLRMGSDKRLSDGLGSTRRAGRSLLAEIILIMDDCLRLTGCVRAIYMLVESRRIVNSNTFGNVVFRWWKCF